MRDDELALLSKIQELVKEQLTEEENVLLSQIIKTYDELSI